MPYPRSHNEVSQTEMEPAASVPTPTNAYGLTSHLLAHMAFNSDSQTSV